MDNLKRNRPSRGNHIVFLGEAGFPKGLASMQRMTLMGKALLHGNYKVTVICRKGVWNDSYGFTTEGSFDGIDYVYTSGSVLRPPNFLRRNFLKIKGAIGEFKYLTNLKKEKQLTAAIISSHDADHVLRYKLYALLIGFPIVLNFVELASSMKGRDSFKTRVNDYIFDNFIVKIVDGALPISNLLMDYYKRFSPSKPSLKLPIICDFDKFDPQWKTGSDVTFLYCGAASYTELIVFIIDSFDKLKDIQEHIHLKLVLGGSKSQLNRVREKIGNAYNKDRIKLIGNVPHKQIPEYFSSATALLIPLRPTVQDAARFPHKIGEYLASGRVMITTRFGEINNYDFNDEENTLIAEKYDTSAFAEKMKYVIENPVKAKEIGQKGRKMGEENFDHTKYGQILRNYFSSFDSSKKAV